MRKLGVDSTLKRFATLLLALFAMIGVWSTAIKAVTYARGPGGFVPPGRLVILEVRGEQDRSLRLFLAGAKDPNALRFEGPSLEHSPVLIEHYQASVPLHGYVVSGSGRIYYDKAVIDVNRGMVMMGDKVLNPDEFTIGPNGEFRQGEARIAR